MDIQAIFKLGGNVAPMTKRRTCNISRQMH